MQGAGHGREEEHAHDAAPEDQLLVIPDLCKEGSEKLLWPLAEIGYMGTKHTAGAELLLFNVVNNSRIFGFSEKSIFNIFLPFVPHKLIVLLTSLGSQWLPVNSPGGSCWRLFPL